MHSCPKGGEKLHHTDIVTWFHECSIILTSHVPKQTAARPSFKESDQLQHISCLALILTLIAAARQSVSVCVCVSILESYPLASVKTIAT